MKLIGVTGKSGAGKTTFSNMLAEKDNIGVIHVDDVLKQIKMKYFSVIMSKDKNGEKAKVNSKLKTILYKNKILFNLFMKFRAKLVEKSVDSEIHKLLMDGKDTIIIDDIFIKYQKRYKELSQIYILKRPYKSRISALGERDKINKEEIVAYDVAHHKGNYKEIAKGNNLITIKNDSTEEKLRQKAEQVYQQFYVPDKIKFREQITVQKQSQVVRAAKYIKKIKSKRKEEVYYE